jgi:hypothetical protein
VCFDSNEAVPKTAVVLAADIDTDSTTDCDQHNDEKGDYCVVTGAGISVPAGTSVRAIGSKPLVLLSTTTFDLSGTIDVSSRISGTIQQPGAGASLTIPSCTIGAIAPTVSSGGYGGSFGGKGGLGQRQDTNVQPTAAPPITFPLALRAGCPGATGATVTSGVLLAAGGAGGGAVSIIAVEIQLNGFIDASGAGGFGGSPAKVGGGGGGSGGMIVLDSPLIIAGTVFALFANGGGGGQGGAAGSPAAGQNGQESISPTTPGAGGANATPGGHGGAGSAGMSQNGADASQGTLSGPNAGGAGGGGAGFIRAPGITTNVSPPPTP